MNHHSLDLVDLLHEDVLGHPHALFNSLAFTSNQNFSLVKKTACVVQCFI